jgi:tripartite-type tricarboxylate transporter receptor subunit TctC
MSALSRAILGAVLCVQAYTACGQAYPGKPVHIVVQTGTGGSIDLVARMLAQKLSEAWAQQVVVDNKPGAGGIVATDSVAKAAPDGYTLYLANESPFAVLPSLHPKLPYDPSRDFVPISLLVRMQYVMVVHPAVPAQSVPELIAYLRGRPGKVNYASPGNGVPHHLGMELFKTMAQVDVVHVPYKTNAAGTTDLLTGQVSLMFNTLGTVGAYIKAGKLRPLAVAGSTRMAQMPELPTVAEAGNLPGFEFLTWVGLVAPTGTPQDIINKIHAESVKQINTPELKERFTGLAFEVVGSTPAEFGAVIKADTPKWEHMVRISGARVD